MKMFPWGSQATSVGRPKVYLAAGGFGPGTGDCSMPSTAGGRRPSTIVMWPSGLNRVMVLVPSSTTQMLSCGSTRTLCELEVVRTCANLTDEHAVLIELEQLRVRTAGIYEHMTFGIGGDPNRFAEIASRRQFEEVRYRVVRNLGYVLRACLHLRECRHGAQHEGGRERDG